MKTLSGTIGFMMLFGCPSEEALNENIWGAMGAYFVWLAVAIALLAYAGAFKRNLPSNKQTI